MPRLATSRPPVSLLLVSAVAVMMGISPPASGQIDCETGLNAAERAICREPVLGALDRELNDVYSALRARLAPGDRSALGKEQTSWLVERNECGARTTCLRTRYTERITELRRRYDVSATQPVSTTADVGSPAARSALCADEEEIRSVNSRTPTTITFENRAGVTLRIYWLDYDGRRQHRATLNRGGTRTQNTYVTHPWTVTRLSEGGAEVCVRIVMPDPGGRTVTLN